MDTAYSMGQKESAYRVLVGKSEDLHIDATMTLK
jgi:hypothetical protein